MRIARRHYDELLAHARADVPNECCGYLRAKDGTVEQVVRTPNLRASPYGYEIDPAALLDMNNLDDEGYEVGIYHSHPRSPAVPSQTDVNLAFYPHWTYVIVSLDEADARGPHARAWRIDQGRVEEEELHVD